MTAGHEVDPFGTAALRAAVLAAWADSPTRFREDANAEEDLLLGGYADRWLVELAQNAADAAQRAGVPGRLLIRVIDNELLVANTGATLDTAGVAALASLRASAKRDTADGDATPVGRFGVGFAAVLPLSAEPRISSGGAGVEFSTDRTGRELATLPGPSAELAARHGQLPVLRLVWPTAATEPEPPSGYATEVRLPLRPGLDADELLGSALGSAEDLLLALPTLGEITVGEQLASRTVEPDGTVLIDSGGHGERRWLVVRRDGEHAAELLRAAPVEQRHRLGWSINWAVPVSGTGDRLRPEPLGEDVLHAPTPSDERLSLPARLIATVPMEPSRRRMQAGPVTDAVLTKAASVYVELVRALPPRCRAMLAPSQGFPLSAADGVLSQAVLGELRTAVWLPGADGAELAPQHAALLDLPGEELPELLATVVPGLLAADLGAPATVLAALGVHRLGAAELVERLAGLSRPEKWWRSLYGGLASAADVVPDLREELAGLPVPLVDGRTVVGPRGTVLPVEPEAVHGLAELALPGLRIVHPDAAHPLLIRLGAVQAGPAELLEHPAVVEAVLRSVEESDAGLDPEPLATAVLGLVESTGTSELGARPWLAALALPDDTGGSRRADELMLPDAVIRPLLAPESPLGVLAGGLAERVPRGVLVAVGVLDSFAVLVDDEPTAPGHDLAGEERWWGLLDEPPVRLIAVRDLDLVADRAWPQALAVLAGDQACRAALRASAAEPLPYTPWWLSEFATLGGHRPDFWRLASAETLAGLYDVVPEGIAELVDRGVLEAIGVRSDITVHGPADAADLLARLADPQRRIAASTGRAAHAALVAAAEQDLLDADDLEPPSAVRNLLGAVVGVDIAVVLDEPWLATLLDPAHAITGGDATTLADLLDLPLASEVLRGDVCGAGTAVNWSELAEVVAACEVLGVPVPPGELLWHAELEVAMHGPDGNRRTVPAWRDDAGRAHASDPLRGLLVELWTGRSGG